MFVGGGVGSSLRYLFALGTARAVGVGFPWATLGVNVLGSFLLAMLAAALPGVEPPRAELKLALGTGVLGGFTTYSTFNLELLELLQAGAFARAGGYMAVMLAACVVGGGLGWALGRALAA